MSTCVIVAGNPVVLDALVIVLLVTSFCADNTQLIVHYQVCF